MASVGSFLEIRPTLEAGYKQRQLYLVGALFNKLDKGTDSKEDQISRAAWGMCHDAVFVMNKWGDEEALQRSLDQNREIILKLIPEDFFTKKRLAKAEKRLTGAILKMKGKSFEPGFFQRNFTPDIDMTEPLIRFFWMRGNKFVNPYTCERCGRRVTISEVISTQRALTSPAHQKQLTNATIKFAIVIALMHIVICYMLIAVENPLADKILASLALITICSIGVTYLAEKGPRLPESELKRVMEVGLVCTKCHRKICFRCVGGMTKAHKSGLRCKDCWPPE